MAVVAAGALALAGCTSDTGSDDTDNAAEGGGDGAEESEGSEDMGSEEDMGGEDGSTERADIDFTTNDDSVSFSSGAEEYNAYNGNTAATNSTYNAVVNNQLQTGFWYWGTDGTVYQNEWFGSYEQTSEDPLTVEYTISDDAVWSDGTPITSNDFLLDWASTNPESMGGAEELGFDPVSTWSTYATEGLETEPSSKTFTVVYPEPYPDWEISVSAPLPAHVAAEQAGMEPDELAQAILDGDAETVSQVSEFWNTGWLFPNYQVEDEAVVPSSGPYTLEGAAWESGNQLALVPNENFFGPAPATGNLVFKFAAPETHVQALQNGDINVIEPQATVDTRQQLEGMGDQVAVESNQQMTWEHLDYNFAEDSVFNDDNGGLAAREAFAMCVPRQNIIDNLIAPISEDAVVLNARERFPFQEGYQEIVDAAYSGQYDEVDIEGASAKLEEAGLETPVEVRIGYSAPNQRRTEEVAQIKSSCDEAGFEIVDAGNPDFFEAGGTLEQGDWEVALFAWAGSGQIASGEPIYSTDGSQNFGGFSNEEVDAAWDTLASSLDEEVQTEQLKIIEKLLWDNLYGIPLFTHPGVIGYDSTLENVRPTSVQTGVSWNADQWVRAS
ncbi:Oligopeptide ABC transporter, periplasmic oligopeptide-binding protein OppA [Serinicoccus hydrothermalis]|uniref:Oligopeptide ABC transporter, periplasmic oligopeptide-binding protein OppA n=1 Tax=Serinicoccus hydrothermalis TaxID=1758689 RepID=A0A1B1N849_9MICO|nr:ABC transporter substrate-binding protein [Serinicoccus hydrothermalis]ANS77599.1 Oligopeptide ABC transporter, periplasmic oligopeptide-binding protein OppA [Serinicoccus hydrothermalis]